MNHAFGYSQGSTAVLRSAQTTEVIMTTSATHKKVDASQTLSLDSASNLYIVAISRRQRIARSAKTESALGKGVDV